MTILVILCLFGSQEHSSPASHNCCLTHGKQVSQLSDDFELINNITLYSTNMGHSPVNLPRQPVIAPISDSNLDRPFVMGEDITLPLIGLITVLIKRYSTIIYNLLLLNGNEWSLIKLTLIAFKRSIYNFCKCINYLHIYYNFKTMLDCSQMDLII